MSSFIIGIDLGTSTCYAYGMEPGGERKDIPDQSGHLVIDSYIAYSNGTPLFGNSAKKATGRRVTKLYELKRLIGKKYEDDSFQSDLNKWPFNVVRGNDGMAEVEYEIRTSNGNQTRRDRPEVLTGDLLKYIKNNSQRYNEKNLPVCAIITIPARFTDAQRKATLAAATLAGFDKVQLFPEPSAAALTYVNGNKNVVENQTFVVYDFGGGTFDVSIIEYANNEFRILETDGDSHLGGADIDNCLMDHYLKELERAHPNTNTKNRLAKIKAHCEEVKVALSGHAQSCLDFNVANADYDDTSIITREEFEGLIRPTIISKTFDILRRCIVRWQEKHPGKDYDGILLVGGSSEIPCIREMLNQEYPGRVLSDITPGKAVGEGAFIRGCVCESEVMYSS